MRRFLEAVRFKDCRLSFQRKADLLRAFPQRHLAEPDDILEPGGDRDEMIARELADFGGEARAAIREQDLGLADAAGIEDDLAGRGIGRVVLLARLGIHFAERNPHGLAAPPDMDALAHER